MRKTTLLLIITIALAACSSKPDLTGKWMSTNRPNEGFVFEKDGNLYILEDNKMMGGESIDMGGQTFQLKYEINYDKNPLWVDWITYDKATKKEAKRALGIINIISEDEIELMVTNKGRPIEIQTQSPDYLRLKRAK